MGFSPHMCHADAFSLLYLIAHKIELDVDSTYIYMYQLQGLLVRGYPPMVWSTPWKAEATPSYIYYTYIHT